MKKLATLMLAMLESKMDPEKKCYLVVRNVESCEESTAARAKNCIAILPDFRESTRRASVAALDESNSAVAVMDVMGKVLVRAYAHDIVRGIYYTTPLVCGDSVYVSSGEFAHLFNRDGTSFPMSEEFLRYPLVSRHDDKLHTVEYFKSISTVIA